MANLEPGKKAPAFNLLDQDENKVQLKDYSGKKLLIYFYPKANTSGWTRQSCAVSDAIPNLGKLNVAAVGISPDKPAAQKKFDEKYELGFPLLSDPDKEIARKYGALGIKNVRGQKKEGIVRSSFLIDEKGKIIEAWYKVKPEDTVPKALEALK